MDSCLKEFFMLLNKNCSYLVLRNWEDLLKSDGSESLHADIDILCDNLDQFVSLSNAKRVHTEKNRDNYLISLGGKYVRFDVRWVGDGYCPELWEKAMLENRILLDQSFYVPEKNDYYYSLSYHALFQKAFLSEEYLHKLNCLYREIEQSSKLIDENDIYAILVKYMSQNGYINEIPKDPGVFLNWKLFLKAPHRISFVRVVNRLLLKEKYRVSYLFNRVRNKMLSLERKR